SILLSISDSSPLSLHDALPIWFELNDSSAVPHELGRTLNGCNNGSSGLRDVADPLEYDRPRPLASRNEARGGCTWPGAKNRSQLDRKSTRLNSSHVSISYAVFC